jgi:hypothetical protein
MLLFLFTGQLLERLTRRGLIQTLRGIGIFWFFSRGCGQIWVLLIVCDEFTYVRREDLESRECILSVTNAIKREKEEGVRTKSNG